MDCTSTPTVVCELGRIANSLADKSPSALQVAQFWVSLLSAIATLAVGALAAYIAVRSHRLSAQVAKDAVESRRRAERIAFAAEVRQTLNLLIEVVGRGDESETWRVTREVANLFNGARASGDPLQSALADEVAALLDRVWETRKADRDAVVGSQAGIIMARSSIWARSPEEYAALPPATVAPEA